MRQPPQDMPDNARIMAPALLRAVFYPFGALLVVFGLYGLEEQPGIDNHVLPHSTIGPLIVVPKGLQLPGGDALVFDGINQDIGMFAVGARQRCDHPTGGPTGQIPPAHGGNGHWRQCVKQRKPPGHPTGVPAYLSGNLPLGQLMRVEQLAQHGALFERVKLSGSVLGQYLTQGLFLLNGPDMGGKRIQSADVCRPNPQITVH